MGLSARKSSQGNVYKFPERETQELQDSGLFVSTDQPYLGVTPDGPVNCDCCGTGGCEIKYLFVLVFFK